MLWSYISDPARQSLLRIARAKVETRGASDSDPEGAP